MATSGGGDGADHGWVTLMDDLVDRLMVIHGAGVPPRLVQGRGGVRRTGIRPTTAMPTAPLRMTSRTTSPAAAG